MSGAPLSVASGPTPNTDFVALALAIIDEETANWSRPVGVQPEHLPPKSEAGEDLASEGEA
jgi:hypothetical protein